MVDVAGIPVAQAVQTALNTNIANSGFVSGDPRDTRTAWVFTSRLRRLGQAGRQVAADTQFLGPGVDPELAMIINPNSVTWDQPKRWVKKDVRNGSVFFHFTNFKGQNNDILTLKFDGNTGNIDLRGDLIEPRVAETQALAKLKAWHNLYLLTREPVLLSDQTMNVQSITLSSQLLPIPVTFRGFYGKVLDFSESAEKPNSRDYSFEFVVTGSDPDLDTVIVDTTNVLTDATDTTVAAPGSTQFGAGVTSTGEARSVPTFSTVSIGE